jgi:hypothetical protein
MKKLIIAIFCLTVFTKVTNGQSREKTFATFSNNQYTFNLNSESQRSVFSKFKTYFKSDADFSKLTIEDPDPINPESTPYAVFDGANGKTSKYISVYFKLNKVISKNLVTYTIDFSGIETGKALGGACQGVKCSSCRKDRNWFLGPVVGCTCLMQAPGSTDGYCNHSTGSGPAWWDVLTFILPLLL